MITSVVTFLLIAFAIGISITTLTWIHKLEDTMCKCSQDFKRDYIKYFLYVYIVFLLFILSEHYIKYDKTAASVIKLVKTLMIIALIVNTIFAIIYITDLKGCKCSEDVRREIYYYLNIIYIAFVGLAIILGVLTYMVGGKPKAIY